MTANIGGTVTEEHKRKTNDSSLKREGNQNMPLSPRLCKDNDLSGRITSLAGSGPPCTSFCSMTDADLIVEELPVRNCKNHNIALHSYPHNSRKPQRNRLAIESRYHSLSREIIPQDEEHLSFRLSQGVKGTDSEFWGLKSLSSKSIGSHLVSITKQNTSSTYNFSQLLGKQKLKGKGVICKDVDRRTIGHRGALMSQEDQMPAFLTKFQSDTLQRSNADNNNNKPSLQGIVKSNTESFDDGLSLREWLKSAGYKMNKSGKLYIFKRILELVDFAHSQGIVLQDLRPSCFTLLPSCKVKYIGSSGQGVVDKLMTCNVTRKRPLELDMCAHQSLSTKQQKPTSKESVCHNSFSCQHNSAEEKQLISVTVQLEEKWYSSPEELNDGACTFSSNIYSLGVLLFELLCNNESWEVHSAVMSDLSHRILPPKFLSEDPKEAGFCLWLLHPQPSSRPNTRMILESDLILESEESNSGYDVSVSDDDEAETEQLLHFLISLKEEKEKRTAKLTEELHFLNEDIKEAEKCSFRTDSVFPLAQMNFPELKRKSFHFQDPSNSDIFGSISGSCVNEARFMSNINQLENSYFSMRVNALLKEAPTVADCDKDKEPRRIQSSVGGCLGSFFEGLCKFAHYSKFKERGTLRNRDLISSANVICALSFDRDEDYVAAAGVSKKIKIFDFSTILSESIDIQYPIVEMSNKSKLSCVCWNSYIRNHLASTDYDGVVQMWDAGTGQPFSQYMEHQRRAWSVHFSQSDPKMFASGSDDCTVKLWNINEGNSLGTIWNPANVCCVQFSAYSTHLLFFGSADYKIYGYDLRQTRIPWCTLAGHGKAVSYVKFIDAETVISSSTDHSLKLWDLKKTSSSGLSSDACDITFKGHSNEKNFVGLSVLDGYIACGSETNEVYCYHRSLPVPITSHKFESIDPISGHVNNDDNNGQFVSSVCWRKKSNMLVAANSIGIVKLLQMA